MPAIQTRAPKVGGLIKKEFWTEEAYCREVVSVNIANLVLEVGTVVWDDASAGTYAQIPANATAIVPAADSVAILIDNELEEKVGSATTGTFDLVCLVKGPSVVAGGLMNFVGTDAATDTVAEISANIALATSMMEDAGIKIETTFSSSQG